MNLPNAESLDIGPAGLERVNSTMPLFVGLHSGAVVANPTGE